MKFTKGKLASVAAAAVLAGTMGFMPATALADDTTTTTTANYGTSQNIEKTYNYGNTPYAAQNFDFSLTYDNGSATKVGTNDTADPTLKTGQDGIATITATDSDTTDATHTSTGETSLLSLVNEYNFTAPGEYTFTLAETNKNNPNISYSDQTYKVRVDVVWDNVQTGTLKINGIAVFAVNHGVTSTTKSANADFTNNSNAASDPITVSKSVSGTAANKNDYFQYTFKITDTSKVSGTYSIVKNGETVATLNADNSYTGTFYLKNGESVSITGLPKDAPFTVMEGTKVVSQQEGGNLTVAADAADNGYTETYKVDNGESESGTEYSGTVKDAGTTVAYNNEKGFAPTTGITMNTLPFVAVGVVAVAGGAALVISRRRHAGEDF